MTQQVTMYTLEATPVAHYKFPARSLPVPANAPTWLVLEHVIKDSNGVPSLELYEHDEGAPLAKRCTLSLDMLPGLKNILDNFFLIKNRVGLP